MSNAKPANSLPHVIGLTGGIGSGKSAAADFFAELGVPIVDTDQIAHALTAANGTATGVLRNAFGAEFIAADGSLDRARMRQHVFANLAERKRLENILHPLIRAQAEKEISEKTYSYIILAVPLLVESPHWQARCTRIVAVDCAEETQLQRVMQRSKLDEKTVRAIIAAQASRETRRTIAHEIIDNTGDFASLRTQVQALHQHFLQLPTL